MMTLRRLGEILFLSLGIAASAIGQTPDPLGATVPDSLLSAILGLESEVAGERVECHPPNCFSRDVFDAPGQANPLSAVTQRTPGVFLQERGPLGFGVAAGSAGNIGIRGVGGIPTTRVLILIDGQPQYSGLFGHPIPDALFSSDFERVEVVRGPASSRYGSNAMGGVLNFITRQQDEPGAHGSAKASYGRYGTHQYAATLGGAGNTASVYGALNYGRTSGVREDRNDGFATRSAFLKATWQPVSVLQISASGNLVDARFHHPGSIFSSALPVNRTRNYTRGRAILTIDNTLRHSSGRLQVYHNAGDHKFSGGFSSSDFVSGASIFQQFRIHPSNRIEIGAALQSYGGDAQIVAPSQTTSAIRDVRFTEKATYIKADQDIGSFISASAGIRLVNHSHLELDKSLPTVAITVTPLIRTSVTVSYARGYRNPTPAEKAPGDFPGPTDRSEDHKTYQLELRQQLGDGSGTLQIVGFLGDADQLIPVLQTHIVQARGISYTTRGLDVFLSILAAPPVRVNTGYSYLHTSTPIHFAPRHNLFAESIYESGPIRSVLALRYISGLYSNTDQGVDQQRFFLADISLERMVADGGSVFLKVENLLDRSYQIDYGYPMPGRSLGIGLKLWW